jgi:hypothetical protein
MAHRDGKASAVTAMRFPTTIRLAALGLLALVCAGCLLPNYDSITPLKNMPEATLYYPGAKVLDEVAHPRYNGPDGPEAASYGHNLAVNATPDEVVAWYDHELATRGWTRDQFSNVVGSDVADENWRKPGYSFHLGIGVAPTATSNPDTPAYAGYSLGVDVGIFEDWPPTSPSPS